eukprot:156191-Rhodomonas_salina.1
MSAPSRRDTFSRSASAPSRRRPSRTTPHLSRPLWLWLAATQQQPNLTSAVAVELRAVAVELRAVA